MNKINFSSLLSSDLNLVLDELVKMNSLDITDNNLAQQMKDILNMLMNKPLVIGAPVILQVTTMLAQKVNNQLGIKSSVIESIDFDVLASGCQPSNIVFSNVDLVTMFSRICSINKNQSLLSMYREIVETHAFKGPLIDSRNMLSIVKQYISSNSIKSFVTIYRIFDLKLPNSIRWDGLLPNLENRCYLFVGLFSDLQHNETISDRMEKYGMVNVTGILNPIIEKSIFIDYGSYDSCIQNIFLIRGQAYDCNLIPKVETCLSVPNERVQSDEQVVIYEGGDLFMLSGMETNLRNVGSLR